MSLMNRKRGTLTGLAAALHGSASVTTGAVAATELENRFMSVMLQRIWRRPDAAEALYLRIQRAARVVCHEPDIRELTDNTTVQALLRKGG